MATAGQSDFLPGGVSLQKNMPAGSDLMLLLVLTTYFIRRRWVFRCKAEERARHARARLEQCIAERTAQLAAANALLAREVSEHRAAEESLHELTARLLQLQDDARRRLARELHDGATQGLFALAMKLAQVREEISAGKGRADELLNECLLIVEQCTGELRTISYLLHPPLFNELGVLVWLRNYVDGFSARSAIQVSLEAQPDLPRLERDLELAIMRIVQEALSNVYRHSKSRTARVRISHQAGRVLVEIADSGQGISAEVLARGRNGGAGVGLASMTERARLVGGSMKIASSAAGTSIVAVFPLRAAEPGAVQAAA